MKPVAACSNRATSPISRFQVDACSSSSSGRGGPWPLVCKICRQAMNVEGGSLAFCMQDLSSDNECLPPKQKKRRGKKSAQSKENLVDLLKEYRLEQKLKDEELEKT